MAENSILHSDFKNGHLYLFLSGRIDTGSAQRMRDEIDEVIASCKDSILSVIVNLSGVSFITSFGLRIFLSLKKNFNDLSIVEVAPDVFNVLRMTGMTKIMTVEKALPTIDVSELEHVPEWNDVYYFTEDTVLRVFEEGVTKPDVDEIVALSKDFTVKGIPTALAFDIVRVGDRYGVIYEGPWGKDVDAQSMGEILRLMHEQKIDMEGKYKSIMEEEKARIKALEPCLGKDIVDRLKYMLTAVPDSSSIIHGRLTDSDIVSLNGEPIVVGLSHVGYGNPLLDIAHLYFTLDEVQKGDFFTRMLRSYLDTTSEDTIAEYRCRIEILSEIYYFTSLAVSDSADIAVGKARDRFERSIASRWDEILSVLKFKMDFKEEISRLERQQFYLDSEVNIDWVAKRLGTNRHYVSDYFNKVLHVSFSDYINNLRLEHAVELIESKRVKLSQVAYSVGFNSDHTFRRLFKERYGCTPMQYGDR